MSILCCHYHPTPKEQVENNTETIQETSRETDRLHVTPDIIILYANIKNKQWQLSSHSIFIDYQRCDQRCHLHQHKHHSPNI